MLGTMFGFGRRADRETTENAQDSALIGPQIPKSGRKPGILRRLGWYADAGIILAIGAGGFMLLQLSVEVLHWYTVFK